MFIYLRTLPPLKEMKIHAHTVGRIKEENVKGQSIMHTDLPQKNISQYMKGLKNSCLYQITHTYTPHSHMAHPSISQTESL